MDKFSYKALNLFENFPWFDALDLRKFFDKTLLYNFLLCQLYK